ncbi:amino acid ABC transporter substrate-binding protein [Rhizobium helianthi]|uniref:Amino acid ABC transporter substrate-binding protein n=1 Tax=Rhizobium helianthi TaxID=1132695 RepID=A0ABW4M1U2_9HYPH
MRSTSKIIIGYGTAPPFSFQNANGEVVGYSIDLCKAMVEEMRKELRLAKLRIEYVSRTPANRLQLLNDGTMDLECSSSTNTPERRKVANFSPPHFIMQTRFVSLARSNIRSIEDLRGKSISVVLGTINIGQILQISRDRKLGLISVPVGEVQDAFDLVTAGKVSAFAMDDVLLYNLVEESGRPQDYVVSDANLTTAAPYGFMSRLHDAEFSDLVKRTALRVYRSPEMQVIYDRWFMKPIGEKRHVLNLPMSEELKASFAGAD